MRDPDLEEPLPQLRVSVDPLPHQRHQLVHERRAHRELVHPDPASSTQADPLESSNQYPSLRHAPALRCGRAIPDRPANAPAQPRPPTSAAAAEPSGHYIMLLKPGLCTSWATTNATCHMPPATCWSWPTPGCCTSPVPGAAFHPSEACLSQAQPGRPPPALSFAWAA